MGIRHTRLLVFAKAPVPGQVKTRLADRIGAHNAAALHERLLLHTLRTARASGLGAVELWCSPDTGHTLFRRLRRWATVTTRAQHGADLGARMYHALEDALTRAPAALLVGSDCPALTPQHLQRAAEALARADLVFIPAIDGGYVLVGARHLVPAVFENIDWGTDRVWAQTRKRLSACGLRWAALPPLWDLDRPEDLERPLPPALTRRRALPRRIRTIG